MEEQKVKVLRPANKGNSITTGAVPEMGDCGGRANPPCPQRKW